MRIRCTLPALAVGLLLAACQSEQGSAPDVQTAIEAQPRMATYQCDDAEPVKVENKRSSVVLTNDDGQTVELPVVPESGGARYALDSTAVVLEGRDMLLMSGRQEPVNCRR